MKLKDLLFESPTDLVAKYYKNAAKSFDDRYNPEAAEFAKKNRQYYDDNFKDWFKYGITPVFEKPGKSNQPSFDHNPKDDRRTSAGYRGKQQALKAAGLPYDKNLGKYNPNFTDYNNDDNINN